MRSGHKEGQAVGRSASKAIKERFREIGGKIRRYSRSPKLKQDKGHERSSVKVTGPKVRNLKCTMCMGYIKVGLQYAQCDCGQTYHVVCLARTGFCPICNKQWGDKEIGSITKTNGEGCSSPLKKNLECPSCGEMVSALDLECKCGAIFVKENDSFLCPECGGRVGLRDMVCLSCGERFRECEIITCPECGRHFDALEGACVCGAFIGDKCPECGSKLKGDDSRCPNCGAGIDIIEP